MGTLPTHSYILLVFRWRVTHAHLAMNVQLDKALNRVSSDNKENVLVAFSEVLDGNDLLLKFDHIPVAVMALTRNRESIARAAAACVATYERMMKTYSVIPTAAILESILATTPEGTLP
jgi:hypothetical protein